MVQTIKFSEFNASGIQELNDTLVGLKGGANTKFTQQWTFYPPGTTAQRPVAPTEGILRFNTDLHLYEYFDDLTDQWEQLVITPNGGGTVLPAFANSIGYYASDGDTISGVSPAINAILATDTFGVPHLADTIPTPVLDNITALSGLTGSLRSPTAISDGANVPVLSFDYTAISPVNYYTVTSAGAGLNPALFASGSDTNISLSLRAKGSGGIVAQSRTGNSPFSMQPNLDSNAFSMLFSIPTITEDRTITWRDLSGTVALLSDIPILTIPVPLSEGGTSANLTASNGGIFYSTASAGAILAGTNAAGRMLQSGNVAAPTWSTATYPSTAGANGNIITSNGTNFSSQPLFTADHILYVATNGNNANNGSFGAPYADPYAAMLAASATLANPITISVAPAQEYSTANLALKPNVSIVCNNLLTQLDVTNPITLDSSWSSATAGSFSFFQNVFFAGGAIDLDFSAMGTVKGVWFENCIIPDLTITGASGNVPVVRIFNSNVSDITIESVSAVLIGLNFDGSDEDLTIRSGGSGGNTSVDIGNCFFGSGSDIFISGASDSTTNVRFFSSPVRGTFTIDSTFVTLFIDAISIPLDGFIFTNGATVSQVHIRGNAPAKSLGNFYTGQNVIVPAAVTSTTNSTAWNLNTAPNAKQTMTENTTLASPSNQVEGGIYTIKFVQDSTPRTLAFNAVYKFPGGVVPIVSTGSGAVDIFTFYSDGTNMRCIGIAQNIS